MVAVYKTYVIGSVPLESRADLPTLGTHQRQLRQVLRSTVYR